MTGRDDRDELGIRIEPHRFVTGLSRFPSGMSTTATVEFEQYHRQSES